MPKQGKLIAQVVPWAHGRPGQSRATSQISSLALASCMGSDSHRRTQRSRLGRLALATKAKTEQREENAWLSLRAFTRVSDNPVPACGARLSSWRLPCFH